MVYFQSKAIKTEKAKQKFQNKRQKELFALEIIFQKYASLNKKNITQQAQNGALLACHLVSKYWPAVHTLAVHMVC